ncbi:MAG: right-handed parallel beta-helix repeat-containing protein [Kiritimatiellaeota bacterium]|nr:right-handed parallel beta-helix repeat-containing protein [Kiritimatiellota bacterium]
MMTKLIRHSSRRGALLLLLLSPLVSGAAAHSFFVDSAQGDDARDGLTPATAWRSLVKVNHVALQPGDKVLFHRGGVWRGQILAQSGGTNGVITYAVYGEGPKPQLLGSVSMNREEDWQQVSPGLWATVPIRYEPIAQQADLQRAHWSLHHEGGAACTLKSSATGLVMHCTQPGTRSNYIQLYTAGLKIEEGCDYVLAVRARCSQVCTPGHLSLMSNGAPFTGYATPGTPRPIGPEWTEQLIRFRAITTTNSARLTWYLGGALPAGATLEIQPGAFSTARCNQPLPLNADVGCVIFDGQTTGFKKWKPDGLKNDGDYFYDEHTWQVFLRAAANPATQHRSVELALRRHIIDEGGRAYVTYENLDLRYGAAHGIGGGSTRHITVRDCDISFIGGGLQMRREDGKPVRFGNGVEFWAGAHDNLVEGCRIWEIYDAALTNQGKGTNVQENIIYRNNIIWNSEYSFEYWNREQASITRNIRFEHNTCVDAGCGWGHRERPDRNGRHLMFYSNIAATTNVVVRDNIFCNATDSLLRLHGRDWTAALTLDHNVWYQKEGPLFLWGQERIGADQFVAFQREHKLDVHAIVTDPKFVAPAARDFRLAPASPLRASGGTPPGAPP